MKYISLKKSRGTIQNRLDNIPKTYLIINNKIKPYRYKLNMMLFFDKMSIISLLFHLQYYK